MNATIVVPCFNEEARLQAERFVAFVSEEPGIDFLFVDDGSVDGTLEKLRALVAIRPERFELLADRRNRGKAEAVRRGVRHAKPQAAFLGYWDADLSTDLGEIPRFMAELESHRRCDLVLGSRVKLLGRTIERNLLRHLLGRVFATCAATALGLPVYDTQCGAKLFRNTPRVRSLFEEPFGSRWCFDVELIARLVSGRGAELEGSVRELPLLAWHDVPGSKVRPLDFFAALRELYRIRRRYPPTRS